MSLNRVTNTTNKMKTDSIVLPKYYFLCIYYEILFYTGRTVKTSPHITALLSVLRQLWIKNSWHFLRRQLESCSALRLRCPANKTVVVASRPTATRIPLSDLKENIAAVAVAFNFNLVTPEVVFGATDLFTAVAMSRSSFG